MNMTDWIDQQVARAKRDYAKWPKWVREQTDRYMGLEHEERTAMTDLQKAVLEATKRLDRQPKWLRDYVRREVRRNTRNT